MIRSCVVNRGNRIRERGTEADVAVIICCNPVFGPPLLLFPPFFTLFPDKGRGRGKGRDRLERIIRHLLARNEDTLQLLRVPRTKRIASGSVRELDRLRRASTVEIHGRDIYMDEKYRGGGGRGEVWRTLSRETNFPAREGGGGGEGKRKFEANFYFRGGGLYSLSRPHLQCKMINGIRE